MANRWIEFVKNNARDKNISYTCAMCEIKTKNLYKPLKERSKQRRRTKNIYNKNKENESKKKSRRKTKRR